jgi:hypothetical protein
MHVCWVITHMVQPCQLQQQRLATKQRLHLQGAATAATAGK